MAFYATFEALNWAASIDDRLDRLSAPVELLGLRFARNRVHHQWADALELAEGFSFPLTFPKISFEFCSRDCASRRRSRSDGATSTWPRGGCAYGRVRRTPGSGTAPLLPVLRDLFVERKVTLGDVPTASLVFATQVDTATKAKGSARDRNAVRTRMLHPAIELANERLEEAGSTPLPEGLTLHGLRHSYISLRLAIGADIAAVARDAGHADAVITAKHYTHVMALGEGEREALRALVDGAEWAPAGTNGSRTASAGTQAEPAFASTMRVRGVAQPG